MGKPVALEARAEEREVRGLISMTTTRPVFGIVGELDVGAADDLDGLDDVGRNTPGAASAAPGRWSASGAVQ